MREAARSSSSTDTQQQQQTQTRKTLCNQHKNKTVQNAPLSLMNGSSASDAVNDESMSIWMVGKYRTFTEWTFPSPISTARSMPSWPLSAAMFGSVPMECTLMWSYHRSEKFEFVHVSNSTANELAMPPYLQFRPIPYTNERESNQPTRTGGP